MCFRKAKWKREVVNDHKFDFVCVDDFKKKDAVTRLKFIWLYLVIIKTILVYVADLWTAGFLLIFDKWSTTIKPVISYEKSKWIYVGCITMSFVLLILDWRKAKSIIASKDISYAFTSIIASRYYALRSYAHHCFFCEINKQKRKVDRIAFFVFFTFKGWKKLVFAEAPRQFINAITLYKLIPTNKDGMNFSAYGSNPTALMAFSLLVFVISATKLVFAFLLYIPLLFHIRGNLKEYCCHKIDKRIDELVKKESTKRRLKLKMIERAVAKGDVNRLKKKDILLSLDRSRRRQPTLPQLDDNYGSSSDYIPPMPIYNQPSPEPILPPYANNNNRLPPSPSHLNMEHEINLLPPIPSIKVHPPQSINVHPPPSHLNMTQHDINPHPPSSRINPHPPSSRINPRPPSPRTNPQPPSPRINPRPPSPRTNPHGYTYNSSPRVHFQPHESSSNVTVLAHASRDERYNPNSNYDNQYNLYDPYDPYNNQFGYGRI